MVQEHKGGYEHEDGFVYQIIQGQSRIEAKVDALGDVRDIALRAEESAKSAHNRLDGHDKQIQDIKAIVSDTAKNVATMTANSESEDKSMRERMDKQDKNVNERVGKIEKANSDNSKIIKTAAATLIVYILFELFKGGFM